MKIIQIHIEIEYNDMNNVVKLWTQCHQKEKFIIIVPAISWKLKQEGFSPKSFKKGLGVSWTSPSGLLVINCTHSRAQSLFKIYCNTLFGRVESIWYIFEYFFPICMTLVQKIIICIIDSSWYSCLSQLISTLCPKFQINLD